MPSCLFHATPTDHLDLLTWLFEAQGCEVHELSSAVGQDLVRFTCAADVLSCLEGQASGQRGGGMLHLQLWVPGSGPALTPRRIELKARHGQGASHRYMAAGWGLVQLYLCSPGGGVLGASHIGALTTAGAKARAITPEQRQELARWDLSVSAALCARVIRKVRASAVSMVAGRPVLAGAAQGMARGEWTLK